MCVNLLRLNDFLIGGFIKAGRLHSHLNKPITHNTCSFLNSKDEEKETITLPELTKRLLEAKQKLAEFPDSLKVSFQ